MFLRWFQEHFVRNHWDVFQTSHCTRTFQYVEAWQDWYQPVVSICCQWIEFTQIFTSASSTWMLGHTYIIYMYISNCMYIYTHIHTNPCFVTSLQIWAAGCECIPEFPLKSGWFRTLRKQLMMQWRPLGVEKSLTKGWKCINMLLYLSRRWEVFSISMSTSSEKRRDIITKCCCHNRPEKLLEV